MRFVRWIVFMLLVIGVVACRKSTMTKNIPVIGHAITGLYNPQRIYKDNTKEAFEYAVLFEGLGGVEIDVQLSADGGLWLYHDADLASQTNTIGRISELTNDKLETVEYTTIKGEKLAKLSDLSLDIASPQFRLYIDLKDYNHRSMDSVSTVKIIEALNTFKSNHPNFSNLFLIVPDLAFMEQFEQAGFKDIFTDISGVSDGLQKKAAYPTLAGVFVRNRAIDKAEVKQLHDEELKIVIFDMRTIFSIRRAFAKNPDEIMVEEFRTALKEM